jgi:hypothetical protein
MLRFLLSVTTPLRDSSLFSSVPLTSKDRRSRTGFQLNSPGPAHQRFRGVSSCLCHADDVEAGFTTYMYPSGLKMMHARATGGDIAMAGVGAPVVSRYPGATKLPRDHEGQQDLQERVATAP